MTHHHSSPTTVYTTPIITVVYSIHNMFHSSPTTVYTTPFITDYCIHNTIHHRLVYSSPFITDYSILIHIHCVVMLNDTIDDHIMEVINVGLSDQLGGKDNRQPFNTWNLSRDSKSGTLINKRQ